MNFKLLSFLLFPHFKNRLRLPKVLLLTFTFFCFSIGILSAQLEFIQKTDIPSQIQIIDIHSADRNTIFAATNLGLYKSTNAGTTWTILDTAATGVVVLDVFALDTSTVFISFFGGIRKSLDGGATWTSFNIPSTNVSTNDIFALDANTIFVSDSNHRIHKSTDGGATWTIISATASISRPTLVHAFNTNSIIAGTGFDGIYKTMDGGANWTQMNNGLSNSGLGIRTIDVIDENTIYISTSNNTADTSFFYKTVDGGTNWTSIGGEFEGEQLLTIQALDANTVFGAIYGTGVVKSTDGGATWTTFSFSSGLNTLVDFAYPIDANNVLAGTRGGMYCGMPPCSVTNVTVSTPTCSDSIAFEVSFNPLASRSGTIEIIENGAVIGSGTTSPITVVYPDSTTSGKTFSIQYAAAPNCPVPFQVFGCSNCNPTNIVITKQSQIDSFQILYGTCDYIAGNLTIEDDDDGVDNITNLNGLFNLIQIGGSFFCLNNPYLGTGNSFRGFNNSFNLQSVGGAIVITGNPNLTGLDLIENVTTVGDAVTIMDNDALTTIGLGNVETIGGAVNISDNNALTTIGLDDVETIGGSVTVEDNSQLTSIDLFDNVETIAGSVTIADNSSLTDFGNLPNITITGTTNVDNNAGTVPVPSIGDPCSCNDLLNIKTGTTITHFHDILTITGTAGDQVILVTGGANFLNSSLGQISNNTTLGAIPASGPFTFDFFHPSDASGSITVSVGGTNLAPFPISVCSASNCIEPIPTMSEWGLLIFGLLVLNLGIFFVQRKAWML